MRVIKLKRKLPDKQAATFKGKKPGLDSFDHLVKEDTDVYKPDGSVLLKYRANIVPTNFCQAAFSCLQAVPHTPVSNRMTAGLGKAVQRTREDGTKSHTNAINPTEYPELKDTSSSIIGNFDRYARFPFCRQTAFNLTHPKKFATMLPYLQFVDRIFAKEIPDRHMNQMEAVKRTHPNWVIHGTCFTTITVNKNWQTRVHIDAGDFKEGFGLLAAFRAGHFGGCYLVFPQFRVAVDMQTAGLLLCDVHEMHGNTALTGTKGLFERISIVLYYREKMQYCLSPEQELERAKKYFGDPRKRGTKLW